MKKAIFLVIYILSTSWFGFALFHYLNIKSTDWYHAPLFVSIVTILIVGAAIFIIGMLKDIEVI